MKNAFIYLASKAITSFILNSPPNNGDKVQLQPTRGTEALMVLRRLQLTTSSLGYVQPHFA